MIISKTTRTIFAAAGLAVFLAACGKKDALPADSVSIAPPASAPVSVSEVQVGRSIGADKRISNATTSFGTSDTLYVAVVTGGTGTTATIGTRWLYNGTQVVDSASQTITPTGGADVTEFHLTKPSGWPKGNYSVEILLNGATVETKTFEVK